MSGVGPDDNAGALERSLADIPGVERVLLDEARNEAWLVLGTDADSRSAEPAALAVVGPDGPRVGILVRPEQRVQRVRFVSITRTIGADQLSTFTVTLEWRGREYHGSATGERAEPIELRSAAAASLAALTGMVQGQVTLKLAGVKQVRAFDAELLVISLYRPDVAPHNLVGAVVAGDDPRRSAALAVLSALNRLLGNYLALP
ncbi:MAG TPA: hypothetical protein VK928_02030 [Longimicrobiales bacterium]|nr:hypothetical protein [Longimicrobiales bacterium]